MEKNKNLRVICVGVGGIGSYFAEHIDKLIELKQIKEMDFTFFDDDIIEVKNMLYQNFDTNDIDSYKTEALEMKLFNIAFERKRVKREDLKSYDLVVLCADNNIIREDAWYNWEQYKIPFIDSRANGKTVGIFSSNTENYLSTLSSSKESTSCQNPFQIERKEIEFGNVVIASILAQGLLTYSRTKKLPNDFMTNF